MILLLLIVVSISLSQIRVLSTDSNEGAFSVKRLERGFCFVGRRSSDRFGYDALLGVCDGGCKTYTLGSPLDDYSYTVERYGGICLGGITTLARGNMDIALVIFGGSGVESVRYMGGRGEDMLWYMRRVSDGYVLVGGVRESDWDILVVRLSEDLKPLWVRRFGTGAHEYAYGVVEYKDSYYIVGRSKFRGNWDAFILVVSAEGKLLSSELFGSERKDYLRYVGLFRGEPLAVGRSEALGTSDVLLLSPRSGLYRLYDAGEYDYGRVFSAYPGGLVLMGDTYREGVSDGLLIFLDEDLNPEGAYSMGSDDVESVRYLDESLFAGYTYSITLDNDVMLGELPLECRGFVRALKLVERRAPLRFYPYPLKVKEYELIELDLGLRAKKLQLREMSPCQE
ncbi:hypothetical protein [Hydrogenivirga sp.]